MSDTMPMTRDDFKKRWESDDDGGGITMEDIADCAKAWGICSRPRIAPMGRIQYLVLKEAGTNDAEDYKPEEGL